MQENKISLFKKNSNGYTNLYVKVNDGHAIQIKMAFFNRKVFNMLCAVAEKLPDEE